MATLCSSIFDKNKQLSLPSRPPPSKTQSVKILKFFNKKPLGDYKQILYIN